MSSDFPIRVPERLPTKINPRPIFETFVELRFRANVPELTLAGLLFAQIRDRYPGQENLPTAQIPEEARKADPNLIYLPTTRFLSNEFILQLGPRVVGLAIPTGKYPGWVRLRTEIEFLFTCLEKAKFIQQSERLGLRYVDFFGFDLYPHLDLQLLLGNRPFTPSELLISTLVTRNMAIARLTISNNATATINNQLQPGSVLDIDVWFGPKDFDLLSDAMSRLDDAHSLQKDIFFGLLKPDFLQTLNPAY
jgi:uncharacterized protein (TIGR04255 family)